MHTKSNPDAHVNAYTHWHTHTQSIPLLLILWLVFDISGNWVVLKETWPLCWQDYALSLSCTTPACAGDCNRIVQQLLCWSLDAQLQTGRPKFTLHFPSLTDLTSLPEERVYLWEYLTSVCNDLNNSLRDLCAFSGRRVQFTAAGTVTDPQTVAQHFSFGHGNKTEDYSLQVSASTTWKHTHTYTHTQEMQSKSQQKKSCYSATSIPQSLPRYKKDEHNTTHSHSHTHFPYARNSVLIQELNWSFLRRTIFIWGHVTEKHSSWIARQSDHRLLGLHQDCRFGHRHNLLSWL